MQSRFCTFVICSVCIISSNTSGRLGICPLLFDLAKSQSIFFFWHYPASAPCVENIDSFSKSPVSPLGRLQSQFFCKLGRISMKGSTLIPECQKQGFSLRLRGGMPNVGMENWTSDFDRRCWNESNPDIVSPLFVPKVII